MDAKITYSISELSSEFEVTTRTIRFYETKSLIAPERNGQTRIYSHADRERLAMILRGKGLGFNLAEIANMLELYEPVEKRKVPVKNIVGNIKEHIEILKSKRDDLDSTLNEMLLLLKEYKETS